MCRQSSLRVSICGLLVAGWTTVVAAEWKPHAVRQLGGAAAEVRIPAKLQIVTEQWNRVAAVPYLIYMPEKDRLLMLVCCDYPHRAMVMSSDDRGTTWSAPKYLHVDGQGKSDVGLSTGLTYLGGGKVMATDEKKHWLSDDYGKTWTSAANPPASNGRPWFEWDPLLVDKDPTTGKVVRLTSFCSDNLQPDGHFQGYVRFSTDEGSTWIDEIKVPEMYAVDEVAFIRAKNGTIVAACRTDKPKRFSKEIDHYGGLGVSISKDNGHTWSKLNMLYEWGRHHPSLVLMPNRDIVMTYVVRKGYVDAPDGHPQFGIEAVVS
ncbi:MAG: glycoside hydrolase, partial [Planctomycetes bacterium]|nr:glycoside hydrolase [Planctomycetota bacterium]MBU4399913.1 glycoside hydrolase [Planctomycetota bacterium]MCG2682098.1 glycoside hydrolase [Planctomycetales bacterium]